MSKKCPPEPPKIDWAEFVEARRIDELGRRFNRPSQMLIRHSQQWLEPWQPEEATGFDEQWVRYSERERRAALQVNLAERKARIMHKGD